MFGIIDESKKFILVDDDREKLRATALMLAKETTAVVQDFDEDGNPTGGHTETKYVPMFDEDTVDEAIKEYADADIETAYTGDKYLAGNAPAPTKEQQEHARANAYASEIDPLHARKARKTILGEWTEEDEAEYVAQVKALTKQIRDKNPYVVAPEQEPETAE